jgi:trypsin
MLLGAAMLAPGGASAKQTVIGGVAAPTGSWDFAAYVIIKNSDGLASCSGSVIAPNVVLTAGHCAVDEHTGKRLPSSAFRVVTGALDLDNAARRQLSEVQHVAVAPGFDFATLRPDSSILVLSTPTTAPVIALATSSDSALYAADHPVVIAGWGVTKKGGEPPSALQTTNTMLQGGSSCAAAIEKTAMRYSAAYHLCTAGGGVACNGDSGGPIIAPITPTPASLSDWRLIGTTSWGDTGCSHLSVASNIQPIAPWIAQQVAAAIGAPVSPPTTSYLPTPPLVRLPVPLDLSVTAHGHDWFRVRILAGTRSLDAKLKVKVKLQFYTGYGFRSFSSLTVKAGVPVTRRFEGKPGRYDLRAVAPAGSAWTAGKSKETSFSVR